MKISNYKKIPNEYQNFLLLKQSQYYEISSIAFY